MKGGTLTSTYESPLRAEQKEATRQRILEAAGRLMQNGSLEEFSFAAIAEEAGVKERTVYRHFPSRSALVEALCAWYARRVRYDIPRTEAELIAVPQQVFPGFAANEQLTRALWSSPQGRAFRLSDVEKRKRGIKVATAGSLRHLPPRQAKWLAAVLHVLITSATWQTLKDYWGLSAEEAGKASSLAIELLLRAARETERP
jgi:AcrR family transcriptional regulator